MHARWLVLLPLLAGCDGCSTTPGCEVPGTPDLQALVDNLGSLAAAQGVAGWSAMAVKSATVGVCRVEAADGLARRAADGGDTPYTTSTRLKIGSVSKAIAATAMLRLLDENGLTPEDPISPWLPSDWVQGPGIEDITFEQLMSHTSGLPDGVDVHKNELMDVVEAGVTVCPETNPDCHGYLYANANYGLVQATVPALLGEPNPTGEVEVAGELLEAYEKETSLAWSPSATCGVDPDDAWAYQANSGAEAGMFGTDGLWACASGGLSMTSEDLLAFLEHFHQEDLAGAQVRDFVEGLADPDGRPDADGHGMGMNQVATPGGQPLGGKGGELPLDDPGLYGYTTFVAVFYGDDDTDFHDDVLMVATDNSYVDVYPLVLSAWDTTFP